MRDFDRPLKGRGRKAAPLIGERLAKEKLKSPLVICSPAVRARETAELVLKSAKLSVDQHFDDRIYEASLRDLLQVVAEIPDARQTVIMVGHNPGFEELLEFLTGEYRRMPTAALAKVKLDVESWAEVKAGEGSLELFVAPKELEAD